MKHAAIAIPAGLLLAGVAGCHKQTKAAPEETQPAAAQTSASSSKTTDTRSTSMKTQPDVHNKGGMQLREDPGDPGSPVVERAVAVMMPTQGEKAHGTVTFTKTDKGLRVNAELSDLPPGQHAYHVHLFGDCSGNDGKTAGTHFNFNGSSEHPPKDIQRITGNLGVLAADKSGKATATMVIQHASLQGPYSIIGRAVIIHAKGNDPKSPPIGAAGKRLACGVIGIGQAKH